MAATRKPRVPLQEQIRLINECRKSGMTDADWYRENDIIPSTFYNWLSRCRKIAADQVPQPSYGNSEMPRPKQDVVPVSIVHDQPAKPQDISQSYAIRSGNTPTVEITTSGFSIRICNGADPALVSRAFQLQMDPSSNSLYLFCGRRRDRIKALFHEPDGFVLIYKRLSVKGGYQWPRKRSEVRNLTWREFDWLMSGIDIDQPKALKPE